MIIYCGLRHFYIRHFKPQQDGTPYILTHNKEIWDFSPELKITPQQALKVPIILNDFAPFAEDWHTFSLGYTNELEVEYPHAWYLRFKHGAIFKQFITDLRTKLQKEKEGGIWGAGQSKLVAKLAAHNLKGSERIVPPERTKSFLDQIPIERLPLPELTTLEKLGIKTLGELANIPTIELRNQFGQRAAILQRLGRGEDVVPFQTRQTLEYSWTLDCTTLDGFLRPLESHELKPYLNQGMEKLASTLKDQHKVAGQIKLEVQLAEGSHFKKKRQLKQATNEPEILKRSVKSLLPGAPIAQINVIAYQLEASPLAQLTMFWDPETPKLISEELPDQIQGVAQIGVELSRRERLLILWEECFS